MSRRLRWFVALAGALSSLLAVVPAPANHNFFLDSKFCDIRPYYRGTRALADGPSSQIAVHTSVFGPAYGRACPRGSGKVTYLGTGERSGIDAAIDHVSGVNLPTGDVPLTGLEKTQADWDLRAADRRGRGSPLHQIPLYVDVQAVGYNLSCAKGRLNLRSQILGLIFSGQITRWNDDRLLLDNETQLARCGATPIRLVKRADDAGATTVFKDYLAKRNPHWAYYKARNQAWPTAAAACKAATENGMADCILSLRGSIGYLQYHAARVRRVGVANIESATSALSIDPKARFLAPSGEGCSAAAASAVIAPKIDPMFIGFYRYDGFAPTRGDWSTVSLTDAPTGYPICSFSYAYAYEITINAYAGNPFSLTIMRTIVDYLWTAIGEDAQRRLTKFDYGRLPPNVIEASRAGLEAIKYFPN